MILIFGGAYNGKLTYAANEYGITADEVFDLANGGELKDAAPFRCIRHLESLTRRAAENGTDAEAILAELSALKGGVIMISREIGSGVVPLEKSERVWRELHGAVLNELARRAERVVRVFYGLGETIK